jgi:MFS family permease
VFQQYYESDILSGYSPSTISWIPSLQIFFMMGMGPFVGEIYDHFGPKWLILIGSIMHVFGVMMTSLGTEYYQILLAQGLCSALGASAIFQPGKQPSLSSSHDILTGQLSPAPPAGSTNAAVSPSA